MINFKYKLLLLLLVFFFSSSIFGQVANSINKVKTDFTWQIDLKNSWKYRAGDNLDWARADYDDSAWPEIETGQLYNKNSLENYRGFAWYRKTISLADIPAEWLKQQSTGLILGDTQTKPYQVYLGDKLVTERGKFPPQYQSAYGFYQYFPIELAPATLKPGRVVIALRVWQPLETSTKDQAFLRGDNVIGSLTAIKNRSALFLANNFKSVIPSFLVCTVFFVAGFYHLQLYRRRRKQVENLWFGWFSLTFAWNHFVGIPDWPFIWLGSNIAARLHFTSNILIVIVLIQFICTSFSRPIKPWLRFYQVSVFLFSILLSFTSLSFIQTGANKWHVLSMLPVSYCLWIIVQEANKGDKDARTLLLGAIFSFIVLFTQIVAEFSGIRLPAISSYAFLFSIILTLIIFESGRFNRVYNELDQLNQELEQKVVERTLQLAESERQAKEANQAKSVFLANMSHELRTPLNSILGLTQVITRSKQIPTDDQKKLNMISRSGEHLLGLINDVLSIAKIESGKVTLTEQEFDLKLLLDDLINFFDSRTENKGLKLIIDITDKLPAYVKGDESKLRQVLINLLGNAVKFTDQGAITLKVFSQNEWIHFEVADTGQGIAENEIAKLFEPFFQTETGKKLKEGSGLGLSISRNFIQLMGGEIKVASKLNEGSCFSFSIPLTISNRIIPVIRNKVVRLAPDQDQQRILIADDREENRLVLESLLRSVGFSPRQASDGEEAIQIWREWQPQLIWMDMRMPIKDGFTATTEIREAEISRLKQFSAGEHPDPVVIIALTASVFEQDREKIYRVGCDDLVIKPYHEDLIFEKLTKHLSVEFIYDESPANNIVEQLNTKEIVYQLSTVPSNLVKQLHSALISGDVKLAGRYVEQIKSFNHAVASEIEAKLKSYQIEEILKFIEKD